MFSEGDFAAAEVTNRPGPDAPSPDSQNSSEDSDVSDVPEGSDVSENLRCDEDQATHRLARTVSLLNGGTSPTLPQIEDFFPYESANDQESIPECSHAPAFEGTRRKPPIHYVFDDSSDTSEGDSQANSSCEQAGLESKENVAKSSLPNLTNDPSASPVQ